MDDELALLEAAFPDDITHVRQSSETVINFKVRPQGFEDRSNVFFNLKMVCTAEVSHLIAHKQHYMKVPNRSSRIVCRRYCWFIRRCFGEREIANSIDTRRKPRDAHLFHCRCEFAVLFRLEFRQL